jgi:hypothetical protein
VPRSRLSGSPTVDAVEQASGVNAPGACGPSADAPVSTPQKRFYSLIIEVRPEEADAETLQLFSDVACYSLAATINLPAGCELRRCTDVSPDFAEVLINR